MLDLIQELVEARLYRNADTLKGKTIDEIARNTYLMVLMLEILRYEDPDFAKKYARDTLAYENFDVMRAGGTDLHNLLAVIQDQNRYDKVTSNPNISLPVLQMKRYLNSLTSTSADKGWNRSFLLKLEGFFKISNSGIKSARRSVLFWNDNSANEKASVRHDIKNYLLNSGQYTDLLIQFKLVSHRHDI